MWHPGFVVGTIAVAGAAAYLLGPQAASTVTGTAAWAAGTGVGIVIGSTPELIDGFNTGRTAADVQAPGPLLGGDGPLESPTQPGPL